MATIAAEIVDLKSRVSAAFTACADKGATLPSSLTTHTLADTIRTIPSGGGSDIEDLIMNRTISGVYTNNRITTLGSYALYMCEIDAVSCPNTTTIGAAAVFLCPNLTTAYFPKVTTAGFSVFRGCKKLTSLTLPKLLTLGSYFFYGCNELSEVEFPSVISIYTNAFYACNKLRNISIPNVKTISSDAFRGCIELRTLSLPNAISISTQAFSGCWMLSLIYFRASTMSSINSNVFYSAGRSVVGGLKIYVPTSLVTYYQTKSGWSYYASMITPFDDWED